MSGVVRHEHFDLYLHSTAALEELLGTRITERRTIHDWLLSTVQRLTCVGRKTWIYKSQSVATVEALFYQQAQSALLPATRYLGKLCGCDTMLIEYIEGRPSENLKLETQELLTLGRRLVDEIAQIRGDLPVYIDISTAAKWLTFVEETLRKLDALISAGTFTRFDPAMVADVRLWAAEPAILRAVEETASLCHGDLNGGNILMAGDAIKLIDWQRPRRAPRDTDLACLLNARELDIYEHVQREAAQVYEFLSTHWMIECKTSHFPAGTVYEPYALKWLTSLLSH